MPLALLCALGWAASVALTLAPSSVVSAPIPWCPQTTSVLELPRELQPVTGSADDQCQHFYFTSAVGGNNTQVPRGGPSLARVNGTLSILVWNQAPIPADLVAEGYNSLADLECNSGSLYVPVSGSQGSALLVFKEETLALTAVVRDPQMDGLAIQTLAVDYGSRLIYAFPRNGGDQVLVFNLASMKFQAPLQVQYGALSSTSVRGSILQQPGVLYLLLTNAAADERAKHKHAHAHAPGADANALTYTVYPLDLKTGVVSSDATLAIAASPSPSGGAVDASGLSNIWSADAWPELGVFHATDSNYMYNFNICSSSSATRHANAATAIMLKHARNQASEDCPASRTPHAIALE